MNPFEMVVAIIVVITIGKVLNTRYRASKGIIENEDGYDRLAQDPDAAAMKSEMKALRERIAVLERIATDERGSRALEQEIEKLRDR